MRVVEQHIVNVFVFHYILVIFYYNLNQYSHRILIKGLRAVRVADSVPERVKIPFTLGNPPPWIYKNVVSHYGTYWTLEQIFVS